MLRRSIIYTSSIITTMFRPLAETNDSLYQVLLLKESAIKHNKYGAHVWKNCNMRYYDPDTDKNKEQKNNRKQRRTKMEKEKLTEKKKRKKEITKNTVDFAKSKRRKKETLNLDKDFSLGIIKFNEYKVHVPENCNTRYFEPNADENNEEKDNRKQQRAQIRKEKLTEKKRRKEKVIKDTVDFAKYKKRKKETLKLNKDGSLGKRTAKKNKEKIED